MGGGEEFKCRCVVDCFGRANVEGRIFRDQGMRLGLNRWPLFTKAVRYSTRTRGEALHTIDFQSLTFQQGYSSLSVSQDQVPF